ncbi:hypothetical protein JCM10213_005067 [Rhodosporidiobolus nylandii]
MPVPSLPLELVSLVLIELRLSCVDDADLRRNGRSIALVCKAWQRLGLELACYRLTLDSPAKAKTTLQHLAANPHLMPLVRILIVVNSDDRARDAAQRVAAQGANAPTPTDDVVALLRGCSSLVSLQVRTPAWVDCDQLVLALSALRRLSRLQSLTFFPLPGRDDTLQTSLILSILPNLEQATTLQILVSLSGIRWLMLPSSTSPSLPLRRMTVLCTRLFDDVHPRPNLLPSLLDLILPGTLTDLVLVIEHTDILVLAYLPRFPNLASLELHLHTPALHTALLPRLLSVLSSFGSSRKLRLFLRRGPPTDVDLAEHEPLPGYPTLSALQAALPPSVRLADFGDVFVTADVLPPPLLEEAVGDFSTYLALPVLVGSEEVPKERVLLKLADGRWISRE